MTGPGLREMTSATIDEHRNRWHADLGLHQKLAAAASIGILVLNHVGEHRQPKCNAFSNSQSVNTEDRAAVERPLC